MAAAPIDHSKHDSITALEVRICQSCSPPVPVSQLQYAILYYMSDTTRYTHLYELHSTALARCISAVPVSPAANTLHTVAAVVILAILAIDTRSSHRV